jgi:hypothetical protein
LDESSDYDDYYYDDENEEVRSFADPLTVILQMCLFVFINNDNVSHQHFFCLILIEKIEREQ